MPGRMEKSDFEERTPVLQSIMQQPSRQGSEIEGCLPLHSLAHPSLTVSLLGGKRQEGCSWPGRVTPVPPQRLGFTATVAVPLPLQTPQGPEQYRREPGAGVIYSDKQKL